MNVFYVIDVKEVEMGKVEVREVEDEKLPTSISSLVALSTSTIVPITTMATSAKKSTKNRECMYTPMK